MIIKLTKELVQKEEAIELNSSFGELSDRVRAILQGQDPMDLSAIATYRSDPEISINCHDCGIQSPPNELIRLDIETEQNDFSVSLCRTCHTIRRRQLEMTNEFHN